MLSLTSRSPLLCLSASHTVAFSMFVSHALCPHLSFCLTFYRPSIWNGINLYSDFSTAALWHWLEFIITINHVYLCVCVRARARVVPRGMMERYLPRNLLATVISCLRVQPRSEIAWWAAAGGWWLTYTQNTHARVRAHTFTKNKKNPLSMCAFVFTYINFLEKSLSRYLFTEGPVSTLLQAVKLECFPQQRVEGFSCTVYGGGVRRHCKGRYVTQLLQWALTLGGSVQQLGVLQILRQTLQHGDRLVKVHLQKEKDTEH